MNLLWQATYIEACQSLMYRWILLKIQILIRYAQYGESAFLSKSQLILLLLVSINHTSNLHNGQNFHTCQSSATSLWNQMIKWNSLTRWLNSLPPLLHSKFQFNITVTINRSIIYDTFCTNLKSLFFLSYILLPWISELLFCYTFIFMNYLMISFLLPSFLFFLFFLNFSFSLTLIHSFIHFHFCLSVWEDCGNTHTF